MRYEYDILLCTLFLLFFTAVVVGFDTSIYTVSEGDGQAELCVNITVPRRQDIGTVTFNLTVETQNGSAGIASNSAQSQLFYFIFSCSCRIKNDSSSKLHDKIRAESLDFRLVCDACITSSHMPSILQSQLYLQCYVISDLMYALQHQILIMHTCCHFRGN